MFFLCAVGFLRVLWFSPASYKHEVWLRLFSPGEYDRETMQQSVPWKVIQVNTIPYILYNRAVLESDWSESVL